nr:hypothetical protein CPGR_01277 [Mycolicibacter nonchromogenicus]
MSARVNVQMSWAASNFLVFGSVADKLSRSIFAPP